VPVLWLAERLPDGVLLSPTCLARPVQDPWHLLAQPPGRGEPRAAADNASMTYNPFFRLLALAHPATGLGLYSWTKDHRFQLLKSLEAPPTANVSRSATPAPTSTPAARGAGACTVAWSHDGACLAACLAVEGPIVLWTTFGAPLGQVEASELAATHQAPVAITALAWAHNSTCLAIGLAHAAAHALTVAHFVRSASIGTCSLLQHMDAVLLGCSDVRISSTPGTDVTHATGIDRLCDAAWMRIPVREAALGAFAFRSLQLGPIASCWGAGVGAAGGSSLCGPQRTPAHRGREHRGPYPRCCRQPR
jgi:hypothetical protein